jgi:NAD(P)H-flavin reductase
MTTRDSFFKGAKTIGQATGRDKDDFFPELERFEHEALVGVTFRINAARIVSGWEGEYGVSDFVLAKIQLEDGKEGTTILGGKAIIKDMRKVMQSHKLPIIVMLNTKIAESSGNTYFVLDDPPVTGDVAA